MSTWRHTAEIPHPVARAFSFLLESLPALLVDIETMQRARWESAPPSLGDGTGLFVAWLQRPADPWLRSLTAEDLQLRFAVEREDHRLHVEVSGSHGTAEGVLEVQPAEEWCRLVVAGRLELALDDPERFPPFLVEASQVDMEKRILSEIGASTLRLARAVGRRLDMETREPDEQAPPSEDA